MTKNSFKKKLNDLERDHLLRTLRTATPHADGTLERNGRRLVNFASNNYLGLAQHPSVIAAAQEAIAQYGVGAGASRLITGTTPLHVQLEKALADFKQTEAALVFSSGHAANVAAVRALVGPGDAVIMDRLNHASLFEGVQGSGARLLVYRHTDAAHLAAILARVRTRYRNVLIATDSVFSMDGDRAPLAALVELAEHHHAMLLVDEAHATGVFGPNGEGLIEHEGLAGRVDVVVGTLSKALGSLGGYVAGSTDFIQYLINTAGGFIYTTALPAACCAAALKALEIVQTDTARRERLWENVGVFNRVFAVPSPSVPLPKRERDVLLRMTAPSPLLGEGDGRRPKGEGVVRKDHNENGGGFTSPIIPIVLGDAILMMTAAAELETAGFWVGAVRPPTVPEGTARLRISLTSEHRPEEIEGVVNTLQCKPFIHKKPTYIPTLI